MKILVTPTSFHPNSPSPALQRLQAFADELIFNPKGKPLEEEELLPLLRDCDGCIAGLDFYTAGVISPCERLKVISRYGAGVDRVDLKAASEKRIAVCNTPGANAQAVADLTMGLILSVARRIPMLDRKTKTGAWVRSTGTELYGKTAGILGLGAVGRAVAKRCQGFSMRVLAYDPYLDGEYAKENRIEPVAFEQLIREADVICLHLPLTPETRHIFNAETMRRMRPGVILVNTARGGLIDEAAALHYLESGHLGGLGLDAYEQEPPQPTPLFELENVVTTPHIAAHTKEAVLNMANMAVENLISVLSGNISPHQVNP